MPGPYFARLRTAAAGSFFPLIALIAALVLMGVLTYQGSGLVTITAPSGMMSLQQAGDTKTATEIVECWTTKAGTEACWDAKAATKTPPDKLNQAAAIQVLLDFPFIVAYAYLFFALGCAAARYASYRGLGRLARFATWTAAAALLAGCFDVIENIGLLSMIWFTTQPPLPCLTTLASFAKWGLIGISYLASLVTLLWPVRQTAL